MPAPYIAREWTPTVPQHAFLADLAFETLYGGAAGGGKSDALLAAALQYVDQPQYRAILFRKTYADLARSGALIDRSKAWLGATSAKWHQDLKTWTFPSGAVLSFGYLDTADDKYRYQGGAWHFAGFDELTQLREDDYRYILSRVRKNTGDPIPLRVRSASNPGGSGWVKTRFVNRATRTGGFIPAKLSDNPYLDQDEYTSALSLLDDQTRAQLLDGDWDARQPGDYAYDDHAITCAAELGAQYDRLVGQGLEPAGGSIALGIDWGENTASIVVWPLEGGGVYIPPSEVLIKGTEPGESADTIIDSAVKFGYPLDKARYDAAGVQSMRTFVRTTGVKGFPVAFSKHKHETMRYVRHLLERALQGHTTRILAVSPMNTLLLDQMRGLMLKDPEVHAFEVVKGNDHLADALVAGVAPIAARHRDMVAERVRVAAEAPSSRLYGVAA